MRRFCLNDFGKLYLNLLSVSLIFLAPKYPSPTLLVILSIIIILKVCIGHFSWNANWMKMHLLASGNNIQNLPHP